LVFVFIIKEFLTSGLRRQGSLAFGFFSRCQQRLPAEKTRQYKVKAVLMLHKHIFSWLFSHTGLGSSKAHPTAERYPPIDFLLTPIDFLAEKAG